MQHWRSVFTDAVEAVSGHSLEGSPHHGVFLQDFVKAVHTQRVHPAVRVSSHARRPTTTCQQTDL